MAAFAALLAAVPVSDVTFDGYHLPKELLLCALAAALAARGLGRRDALTWLAWGFAALTALSALGALNGWLAARAAVLTLAGVVLFDAARALDEPDREWLVRAVTFAAAALALIAFAESQGLLPGLSCAGRAPGAMLGQRNAVAHALTLASPAAWWCATRARGFRRVGYAALSLLLVAVVVLTRCRAAWLALPLVLAAWLVFTRGRGVVIAAVAAFGAALAALLPSRLAWSSATPLKSTLTRLVDADSGSGLGRLTQWSASLGLLPEHPLLGVGPANWMVAYPRVSPPGDATFREDVVFATGRLLTSDWVSVLVERGLPVAVCGLALAVAVAARLVRATDPLTPVAASVLAGLVVMGQLDSVLQVPPGLALAALLLGVGVPRDAAAPAPGGARLAVAGVLALGAVNAALLFAAFLLRTGGGSFEALEWAAKLAPGDPLVRQELSEAYVLQHRCADARPHLDALARQLPFHTAVKALVAACEVLP